jgi:ribonuclease MRP protein subunit RMP1
MAVVNSFQPIPVAATLTTNTMHHPQITSATLLRSSPKDQESLLEIHELLNSLFIRNRNQHRRNHWFKSLQQFRKQLGLLLQEMGTQGTTTGRSKYSARQIEERLTARLRYWDEKCIHQWYL